MRKKSPLFIIIILFVIGNIPLLININSFIYLGSSNFSDIPISHYPNLSLIKNSIINYHQLPLWSDLIFSGYPFSSNPLSGLWYFPGWIALIFPLPVGINISLLVHLLIGMAGMFYFLREMEISKIGAIFGAIAFAFSTKIYAHIGAGHLSLLYAIIWTPWCLKFIIRTYDVHKISNFIIAGLLVGLMASADLRWLVPFSLIWLTVLVYSKSNIKLKVLRSIIVLIIGLLASIAVWLPLLDLLPFTTRSNLSSGDQLVFSMTPIDFINVFFPMFEGSAELRVYVGAISIVLFVLGIGILWREKYNRVWYFMVIASLLLSFGENIPGLSLFYDLPGISLTRVPARFLFPFLFGVFVLSSKLIDQFQDNKPIIFSKRSKLLLLSIYLFVVFFSTGAMISTKSLTFHFLWPMIFFTLSLVLIFLKVYRPNLVHNFQFLFVFIIFIDLVVINYLSLTYKTSEEALFENTKVVEIIKNDPSNFRVYTPSYSISQEVGAFWNINQVNGVDPIHLQKYSEFFVKASGIPVNKYTVSLPPFEGGNPSEDNAIYCPNIDLLMELNTKYVISDFNMNGCLNFDNISPSSGKFLYQISETDNYLKFLDCEVELQSYSTIIKSPNQISFNVNSCGGLLKVSEISYPGWNVFVDGKKVNLEPEDLFRTFYVPEGQHKIEMIYHPNISIISAYAQLLFWLAAIGLLWNDTK